MILNQLILKQNVMDGGNKNILRCIIIGRSHSQVVTKFE